MGENIERFERIRSYIKGEMSIEEAAAFERELLHDKGLASEFERIELISKAVVKVHKAEQVKEDLEMVEREMAEADKLAKSLRTTTPFFKKVQQWFTPDTVEATPNAQGSTMTFASRMVLTCAVAAALALGVFLPINNHHMAVSGFAEAGEILKPENLQFYTFRGDDEIADKLTAGYEEIKEGRYQEAFNTLTEVEGTIDEQLASLSGDDSAVLRVSELNKMKQEAEWYRAILLMHDKKVGKAKKLLRQISKSGSVYSEEAKEILKSVY